MSTHSVSTHIAIRAKPRLCGGCTKCCEGNVYGDVDGKPFYKGNPCSFLAISHGCSVHNQRPTSPCREYQCLWLANGDIPLWMKPDAINAIFSRHEIDNLQFVSLVECDAVMRSEVLSWAFMYAIQNGINFCWQVKGGFSWIGTPQFNNYMSQKPQGTISFPM